MTKESAIKVCLLYPHSILCMAVQMLSMITSVQCEAPSEGDGQGDDDGD